MFKKVCADCARTVSAHTTKMLALLFAIHVSGHFPDSVNA
jgi:hypothetical protein